MYRSYTIMIRKLLASLVLAAAVLAGALVAEDAVIIDSPTHTAGDGFVWPNGATTMDGSH